MAAKAAKPVRDYMTRDPACLREDDVLRSAVELVLARRIRHIPVLDPARRLVGIVTDRDVKRALPSALTPDASEEYETLLDSTPLSRIMTREPLTVGPETGMAEAVGLLLNNKIGGLPVVQDGALVGILTDRDALRAYLDLASAS